MKIKNQISPAIWIMLLYVMLFTIGVARGNERQMTVAGATIIVFVAALIVIDAIRRMLNDLGDKLVSKAHRRDDVAELALKSANTSKQAFERVSARNLRAINLLRDNLPTKALIGNADDVSAALSQAIKIRHEALGILTETEE